MVTKEEALKVIDAVFTDYFFPDGCKGNEWFSLMKELKLAKSFYNEENREVITHHPPTIIAIYEALGITKDELQLYLGITNKPTSSDVVPDFGGKNL